ncbi:nucleoside phosphorylase [candidate division KSB1 bacterium]|nr:nucleoside phosphorylase [candidate division KSB1 bacterium]
MAFPCCHDKFSHPALFSPADFIHYLKKRHQLPVQPVPENVIICYHPPLMQYISQHYSVQRLINALHRLEYQATSVGVIFTGGIGAPLLSVHLEEAIALGIKKCIAIGTSGALQKSLKIGDIVLANQAIRDEGTSYHYLAAEKWVHASAGLVAQLRRVLEQDAVRFQIGATWTIDAPYRETITEIRQYQTEGVLCVEMEAAALFAIAQYRNIESCALFTISDSLAELKWKPAFHQRLVMRQLKYLFQAALAVLATPALGS